MTHTCDMWHLWRVTHPSDYLTQRHSIYFLPVLWKYHFPWFFNTFYDWILIKSLIINSFDWNLWNYAYRIVLKTNLHDLKLHLQKITFRSPFQAVNQPKMNCNYYSIFCFPARIYCGDNHSLWNKLKTCGYFLNTQNQETFDYSAWFYYDFIVDSIAFQ